VSDRPLRAWPFAVLAVLVVLAAGGTGLFFGSLASLGYNIGPWIARDRNPPTEEERRTEERVSFSGPAIGGVTGTVTGLAWSLIMIHRAFRRPSVPLVGRGTLLGIAAGALSAAVLHVGLLAIIGRFDGAAAWGILGLPAGAVVGAICGGLCVLARRLASPEGPP
jgi:hypothetical protein